LLATFVVNQVNDLPDFNLGDGVADSDSGTPGVQISLRSAIQNANLDAALDDIHFGIAGAGVKLISPTSALPSITQPVVIDGYTQPTAAPNTLGVGSNATILIHLDGLSAGAAASGLTITGGGSTVRGLAITRFKFQGIEIEGPGNFSKIVGNFIGVPPAGNADQGNTINGVLINNSEGNEVGGPSPADRNVISGNNSNGVALAGTNATNNIIQGNYIGTNAAGDADVGNTDEGVIVSELTTGGGVASHTMIGGPFSGSGNVISGNNGSGVALIGADAQFNEVQGNRIGTNATGTAALGNSFHGVLIAFFDVLAASNNTIGGVPDAVSSPNPRNIISGNGRAGVAMFGTGATGNKVQGNYIGTDITGTFAISNLNDGVRLGDASLGAGPSANFIGGTTPGAGNLISGNTDNGIELAGATTSGNMIEGNLIGTNVAGNAAVPNSRSGVLVDGAANTRIGGPSVPARNVISGNSFGGIRLTKATAIGNRIEGNYIGVQINGTSPLGNQGEGVLIDTDASINVVGGTTPEAGNVIAYSLRDGVFIESGTQNTVRLNSIHSNGGIGIDLSGPGVNPQTLNDVNDSDTGPNNLQNWPEIVLFSHQGLFPQAMGFFDAAPNTTYTLDFYSNSGASLTMLGEGQQYLSTETLTTDANGYVQFSFLIPLSFPIGKFLTVTATDPDGNTSEFSHDADTDGLYDHWESGAGVDGNGDNTADFYLNNPNPLHKDIYVEVDAMGVIDPAIAGLSVSGAFDLNPLSLSVLNPDGVGGITLHFELDPDAIFQQPVTDMATLRTIKQAEFGTQGQQNNANLLAAKRMTHRYAVYTPWSASAAGESWTWSHEFYISIGAHTDEDLAAVFMHELGHALKLGHGGGDDVQYKPNYHSVMNYMWQNRDADAGGFRDSWRLDYSDTKWLTLDENFLVEAAGIGGHVGHSTKIGPLPARVVPESGPVDWNDDGDTTDVITTGLNINQVVMGDEGDGTILVGHDDWSNLILNFRHSNAYRTEFGLETGASAVSSGGEDGADVGLSFEILAELNDIGYTNKAVRVQGLPDVYANEGDTISFTVPATDPEGDALTFALAPGAPPDAMIHPTTGQFTWPTDAGDGYGEYIITVQVTEVGSGRLREQNYGFLVDVGLTGDYNLNGAVDAADYVVWRNTQGTTGPLYFGADSSGNGIIDQADYLIWRANFGKTLPPPASGSSEIAATARTESLAPVPQTLTEPETRAVQPATLAAGAVVQTARPRINAPHPARRELVAIAASHDDALVAWLASTTEDTQSEFPDADLGDLLSEPDGAVAADARAVALSGWSDHPLATSFKPECDA
jgi:hypothetical protein